MPAAPRFLRLGTALLLAGCAQAPVRPPPPTDDGELEVALRTIWEPIGVLGELDAAVREAAEHGTPEGLAGLVERRTGLPPEAAAALARAIVFDLAARRSGFMDDAPFRTPWARRAAAAFRQAAALAPGDRRLIERGVYFCHVWDGSIFGPIDDCPALALELLEAVPDPGALALSLVGKEPYFRWYASLPLAYAVAEGIGSEIDLAQADGVRPEVRAALWAELRARGPGDDRALAAIASRQLAALLQLGLVERVRAVLVELPPQVRDSIRAGGPGSVDVTAGGHARRLEPIDLRLDLAAADLLAGDVAGAARAVEALPVDAPSYVRGDVKEHAAAESILRALLRRAAGVEREGDEPFELGGRAEREHPAGRLWQRVHAAFLARDGFGRDARRALRELPRWRPDAGRWEELLAPGVRARVAELERAAEQEWTAATKRAAPAAPRRPPADDPVSRLLADPPPLPWGEWPLPPEHVREQPARRRPGELEPRPLEPFWPGPEPPELLWPARPFRGESRGGRNVVLTIRDDYDPADEASAGDSEGGLWLLVADEGWTRWERRVYTGLRHLYPYAPVAASSLPMLARDGRVRLEVEAYSTAGIRGPGCMLRNPERPRLRRRIFVEAPLSALTRDGDGDGLPDVAERSLLTDTGRADTDGDGLPDGADPLPQVPHAARPAPERALLEAALAELFRATRVEASPGPAAGAPPAPAADRELDPTRFVILDADTWAPVARVPGRVVALTEEQARHSMLTHGLTSPSRLDVALLDAPGQRAFVWYRSACEDELWRIEASPEGGFRITVVESWVE